jgi:TonB family protein
MKTYQNKPGISDYKILALLSLVVLSLIAFSSCNKNKSINAAKTEVAATPDAAPLTAEDAPYNTVDQLPVFNGGDKGILDYVAANIVYPEKAALNHIEGKVVVKFVVLKDGSVSQVSVLKSDNVIFEAEAIRVVSTLKFDKPAMLEGKAVAVNYMIPINFKIN